MSFFKAYDMRGTYGVDFDLDTVYRVGRWLPSILGARTFLVGRDMRLTSEAMRDALVNGLVDASGRPIPVILRYPHEMDGGWFWW